MNAEELLASVGWVPQDEWRRQAIGELLGRLGETLDRAEIRRWLRRPQATLGRRTPLEALRLMRDPDDPLLRELQNLAMTAGR